MASFAFCVAFVTIASAMSSIAVATEAGDWYLMTLYLGSSDRYNGASCTGTVHYMLHDYMYVDVMCTALSRRPTTMKMK